MYSYEIQKLLEIKQFLLESKEYLEICEKSPQIIRITYDSFNDFFTIKTNDNYEFKFKVRRKL